MRFYTVSTIPLTASLIAAASSKPSGAYVFGPIDFQVRPISRSADCRRSPSFRNSIDRERRMNEIFERKQKQMDSIIRNLDAEFMPAMRRRWRRSPRFNNFYYNSNTPRYQIIKPQGLNKNNIGSFDLILEVPGFKADDINVQLERDGRILRISAKNHFSEFNQLFRIDQHHTDVNKIEVSLVDGILKISAPSKHQFDKKNEQAVQKLPIKENKPTEQKQKEAPSENTNDDLKERMEKDNSVSKNNESAKNEVAKTTNEEEDKNIKVTRRSSLADRIVQRQKNIDSIFEEQERQMNQFFKSFSSDLDPSSDWKESWRDSVYPQYQITKKSSEDEKDEDEKIEENENFELKMDVRGFESKEIDIELMDNGTLLRVSGKRESKTPSADDDENQTSETNAGFRYYSSEFRQVFRFDSEKFDEAKMEASVVDGVLRVSAPKREEVDDTVKKELEGVKKLSIQDENESFGKKDEEDKAEKKNILKENGIEGKTAELEELKLPKDDEGSKLKKDDDELIITEDEDEDLSEWYDVKSKPPKA